MAIGQTDVVFAKRTLKHMGNSQSQNKQDMRYIRHAALHGPHLLGCKENMNSVMHIWDAAMLTVLRNLGRGIFVLNALHVRIQIVTNRTTETA